MIKDIKSNNYNKRQIGDKILNKVFLRILINNNQV